MHHYKVIGFIPLSFLASLDWGDWIYGLMAAIIQGGASSVASGFSLLIIAPESFNMTHPELMIKAMLTMFLVNGLISGFSFLRNKPVPPLVETTQTVTKVIQPGQAPTTVTSIATKTVDSVPGPPTS